MVTSPYEWKPLKWDENTQNKQRKNKQFTTFIKSEKSTNRNIYKNTRFKISETLGELENKALEASSMFNKLLYLENYTKKTIFFPKSGKSIFFNFH